MVSQGYNYIPMGLYILLQYFDLIPSFHALVVVLSYILEVCDAFGLDCNRKGLFRKGLFRKGRFRKDNFLAFV